MEQIFDAYVLTDIWHRQKAPLFIQDFWTETLQISFFTKGGIYFISFILLQFFIKQITSCKTYKKWYFI